MPWPLEVHTHQDRRFTGLLWCTSPYLSSPLQWTHRHRKYRQPSPWYFSADKTFAVNNFVLLSFRGLSWQPNSVAVGDNHWEYVSVRISPVDLYLIKPPSGQSGGVKCLPSKVILQAMLQVGIYLTRSYTVSLPRLEGFDWRVDVKTSSNCATRMAAPTCLLEMKVGTVSWNKGL